VGVNHYLARRHVRGVGRCFCYELFCKLMRYRGYENGSNGSLTKFSPVSEEAGHQSIEAVRHMLVRRCLHADNFDNICIAISAGTNPPDGVDTFALSYLSQYVSPRFPAGVEGGHK
jgi:hypothetical protein